MKIKQVLLNHRSIQMHDRLAVAAAAALVGHPLVVAKVVVASQDKPRETK